MTRRRSRRNRDLSEDPAGAGRQIQPRCCADDPAMSAGQAIYRDTCSACHGLDGRGVPQLYPSLADSPSARALGDPTTSASGS